MREDAEEAAKLAGLDFKIDILMNSRCEVVGLFAGDPVAEYYAATQKWHMRFIGLSTLKR